MEYHFVGENSTTAGPNHLTPSTPTHASTCTLLPGLFGVLVQCALLFVSITVLVVKKLQERSDRSWRVFLLDSSKQLFGAGFIHLLNMLTSTLLGDNLQGDPCDWYWMSIMVDTTLGVFLEYLWLLVLTQVLERVLDESDMEDLRFGEYSGDDGKIYLDTYAKQLGLWFCCIIGMKIVVILLLVLFQTPLLTLSSILLLLFSWSAHVKLIFVMVVTPCFMNAFQFWVTDNFIQKGGASYKTLTQGLLKKILPQDGSKDNKADAHDHSHNHNNDFPQYNFVKSENGDVEHGSGHGAKHAKHEAEHEARRVSTGSKGSGHDVEHAGKESTHEAEHPAKRVSTGSKGSGNEVKHGAQESHDEAEHAARRVSTGSKGSNHDFQHAATTGSKASNHDAPHEARRPSTGSNHHIHLPTSTASTMASSSADPPLPPPNDPVPDPLLAPRREVSTASIKSVKSLDTVATPSIASFRPNSDLKQPLLQQQVDPFAERNRYEDAIQQMQTKINGMQAASQNDQQARELAEAKMKLREEQMLEAKEQLQKASADLKAKKDAEGLLNDKIAVKEERERQLVERLKELEIQASKQPSPRDSRCGRCC